MWRQSSAKHDTWPPSFDRGTFGRQTIDCATFDRQLIDRRDIRPPPNSLQLCNAKWLFKVTQGRLFRSQWNAIRGLHTQDIIIWSQSTNVTDGLSDRQRGNILWQYVYMHWRSIVRSKIDWVSNVARSNVVDPSSVHPVCLCDVTETRLVSSKHCPIVTSKLHCFRSEYYVATDLVLLLLLRYVTFFIELRTYIMIIRQFILAFYRSK